MAAFFEKSDTTVPIKTVFTTSHMKKVLDWYHILEAADALDFENPEINESGDDTEQNRTRNIMKQKQSPNLRPRQQNPLRHQNLPEQKLQNNRGKSAKTGNETYHTEVNTHSGMTGKKVSVYTLGCSKTAWTVNTSCNNLKQEDGKLYRMLLKKTPP